MANGSRPFARKLEVAARVRLQKKGKRQWVFNREISGQISACFAAYIAM